MHQPHTTTTNKQINNYTKKQSDKTDVQKTTIKVYKPQPNSPEGNKRFGTATLDLQHKTIPKLLHREHNEK